MSTLMPVEFGKQFAAGRSAVVSMQLLENCYGEPNSDSGRSDLTIMGTPGLKLLTTVGTGPCRGIHALGNNELYMVSGSEVYRITRAAGDTFTATLVGGIAGTGQVDMLANATQVAVVTDTLAYSVNASGVVTLPEANLVGAAYQDGYGIFPKRHTDDWYISAADDITSIAASDFTNADTDPDAVVGAIADHGLVGIFGEKTIEWYQNTGNQRFPFERVQRVERGCAAGGTIAKDANKVYWLGDDLQVYEAAAFEPRPISSIPVTYEISRQTSQSAGRAYIYTQEGRKHYVLTLPSITLVYDITTGLWHKRVSDGESRWRASEYAKLWGKHIVGDFQNGNLYELDLDTYDENGSILRRRLRSGSLFNLGHRAIVDEIYIDMEMGVGLDGGVQGSDPQLMLRHTDDAGKTWSNELWRSLGQIGERTRRARWHRGGATRSRVYELSMTDPVPFRMLGSYARVERLAA